MMENNMLLRLQWSTDYYQWLSFNLKSYTKQSKLKSSTLTIKKALKVLLGGGSYEMWDGKSIQSRIKVLLFSSVWVGFI